MYILLQQTKSFFFSFLLIYKVLVYYKNITLINKNVLLACKYYGLCKVNYGNINKIIKYRGKLIFYCC